jgi:hypothetical protein
MLFTAETGEQKFYIAFNIALAALKKKLNLRDTGRVTYGINEE